MEKFVLDSPALEDAVKLRSTANYPPRRPGRNSLKEVQATGGAGAGPEYNGYFTIKDVSTYNEDGTIKEYRVAVCDGATWDAAKQTSGDSYYIVSDTSSTRRIPCTILTIKGDSDLYIRYCHCKGTADIVVRRDAPINNTGYYYYLLGSIRIVNHAMKILQRHGAYKVYLNDDRYEYVRNYNAVPTIQVNGYTGYFCIRIIEPKPSDDGTIPEPTQFAICDGNTWDPDTKTSEKSTVYVNDRVWRLSPFISDIDKSKRQFFHIRFDYKKYKEIVDSGNTPSESDYPVRIEVVDSNYNADSGTIDVDAYGEIGSIYYNNVTQVHTDGVMRIWAFTHACGGGDRE